MEDKMGASALPPGTPRDIRLGMTQAEDVAFPLRWGILGAGEISRQWVLALSACQTAIAWALSDDIELQRSIEEVVTSIFEE